MCYKKIEFFENFFPFNTQINGQVHYRGFSAPTKDVTAPLEDAVSDPYSVRSQSVIETESSAVQACGIMESHRFYK